MFTIARLKRCTTVACYMLLNARRLVKKVKISLFTWKYDAAERRPYWQTHNFKDEWVEHCDVIGQVIGRQ
jgi:hypothetical protein